VAREVLVQPTALLELRSPVPVVVEVGVYLLLVLVVVVVVVLVVLEVVTLLTARLIPAAEAVGLMSELPVLAAAES
jgi:hypothetical protein